MKDAPESLCVVHLVWAPLGLEPFRRFLAAYQQNPGGVSHRLLVVFNGFDSEKGRQPFRALLGSVPHDELVLPQPVQDITAYFAGAAAASEDRICFLNSYSVPLDAMWLQKLCDGLDTPGLGAVGATGSAESHFTSRQRLGFVPGTRRWARIPRRCQYQLRLLKLRWLFRPVPNYHLRSNAFLLGRELFLSMCHPIPNKEAAERFESGRRGLTSRLWSLGLSVAVVGRDGVCYAAKDWKRSHTFRCGRQENLLVADNRTLDYEQASDGTRDSLATLAWGAAASV